MSLASAAALIWTAGVRNRIRRQLQRMRQPKYLLATLAGALYFWMALGRRMRFAGGRVQVPTEVLYLFEVPLVLAAMIAIASAWLFGTDKAELTFTEAEIQFLFPAPISRRALLAYRLAKSALRTMVSAAVMTVFSGRWLTGHPFMMLAGSWLSLATLNLHLTGAALTRASMLEAGRFALKRRLGTLAVALAVLGAILWWAIAVPKPPPPATWSIDGAAAWVSALMSSPPLSWVLAVVRAPIRVALAHDASTFTSSLVPSLAIFAIHYGWVLSSNAAFEESSIEAAERRARAREARRLGRRGARIGKNRWAPFRLSAEGPPGVALVWKNLIAAMRVAVPRMMLFLFAMAFATALSLMRRLPGGVVVAVACALLVPTLVLLGPGVMRIDFRQDLAQMDILRSLPMTGREVVWAEMLGPALIVAVLQWTLLAVGLGASSSHPIARFDFPARVAVAVSAAMLAPTLAVANLGIQNAGVLLLPSWVSSEPGQARGIEALGQRLLTFAGTLLVLFFALIPAGIVGTIVALVLWKPLHFGALPLASAASTGLIGLQLHLGIRWLGSMFDRFDVSLP